MVMRNFMKITKALSDENRVRILLMLCNGELCVCQIIEVLNLAPSTVSKHLSKLHQAHLINSRKDGRWMYYRLSEDAPPDAAAAVRWVKDSLVGAKQATEDAERLKTVSDVFQKNVCNGRE